MPLSAQWSLFGTASFERRRYGGADPLFLIARRDSQTDLTIGASWKLNDAWTIKPQIAINKNNSNIVINDSSKTTVSVVARYDF